MSVATVPGYDATTGNVAYLPRGQAAGYTTGPGVAWTPEQWAAHAGALRICQDPGATDATEDYLDAESGAATLADGPGWYERARASFEKAVRPGQRWPAIYESENAVTDVVNALIAGGVTSGCGLIIAEWGLSFAEAVALVANPSGPFPVVGVQWKDAGPYDCNVFSVPWLRTVSGQKPPPPPPPGTYGRPRNLRAVGGDTSVALTWDAPGTPGLPAPAEYEIFIYAGTHPDRFNLVHSYPRIGGSPWQGGSLERGKTYTAHVVAAGADGTHVRPYTYASATFATG